MPFDYYFYVFITFICLFVYFFSECVRVSVCMLTCIHVLWYTWGQRTTLVKSHHQFSPWTMCILVLSRSESDHQGWEWVPLLAKSFWGLKFFCFIFYYYTRYLTLIFWTISIFSHYLIKVTEELLHNNHFKVLISLEVLLCDPVRILHLGKAYLVLWADEGGRGVRSTSIKSVLELTYTSVNTQKRAEQVRI